MKANINILIAEKINFKAKPLLDNEGHSPES